jgi:hypothetical protein
LDPAQSSFFIYEVAISRYGRTYAEGKKSAGKTDWAASSLWCAGAKAQVPGSASALGRRRVRPAPDISSFAPTRAIHG